MSSGLSVIGTTVVVGAEDVVGVVDVAEALPIDGVSVVDTAVVVGVPGDVVVDVVAKLLLAELVVVLVSGATVEEGSSDGNGPSTAGPRVMYKSFTPSETVSWSCW